MVEAVGHDSEQHVEPSTEEVVRRHERNSRKRAIENRPRYYGLGVEPENPYDEPVPNRTPGDTNIVKYGFDLHPQVTFWAAGFLLLFIGLTLAFSEAANDFFGDMLAFIGEYFGWFYILVANIFVVAVLVFAFSKYGRIRLGGQYAKPDFSNFAWYAMLISAGMGIGIMFWSVAEPINHYETPSPYFDVAGSTPQSEQAAMITTFFHWGIHPWAIYALVSLALAFFTFNRGLPLTMRSVFYPILKERIYGFWGNAIDTIAVIATLFGLATSLGFGVQQVSAGSNFLFGSPDTTWFQVCLIAAITGLATISVVAGLDGGVKRVSQLNLYLAVLFLGFVLVVGPTLFILGFFLDSTGAYFRELPGLAFYTESISGGEWQSGWTIFYWGWWISWAPFVGMFIARVSKGRTVREFVVGVVLVPSLLTFFWMATFGGSALHTQSEGIRDVAAAVNENTATALFDLLEAFPWTFVTSLVGIILVVSFFVTSSDSGSLVVDHLTSGGKLESPVPQRVFWATMEGAVAAALLIGGGLQALQSASVATGLVFSCVLLVSIYSLKRAFDNELLFIEARMPAPPTAHLAAREGARMRAEAEAEELAELEELEAVAQAQAEYHEQLVAEEEQ
ncbi:choline/glycine/proline betaine transport protein [Ilumatobacter fluminis]|uniref:Choline/glycine/proline betaine transport protein n=1 Tax=Ilumatobacter fluminis TaxID=467091 RepID=A0A4R7HUE6_9ACTN|nr:choline/glycine/proline betaine transport protein [Ilumatobacter fluminis]